MTCADYRMWSEHPIVVFDVETTGLSPDDGDRIVEVGACRFEDGVCVKAWGSFVNPGRPIPEEASKIHGIDDTAVQAAPPFCAVVSRILAMAWGAQPAAYNAAFDKSFLLRELSTFGVPLDGVPLFNPVMRWIDPLVWMRHTRSLWKNKLSEVCQREGVVLDNAHRAYADAKAAGEVLFRMTNRIPKVTLCELLRQQTIYEKAQQQDFDAWFAQKEAHKASQ